MNPPTPSPSPRPPPEVVAWGAAPARLAAIAASRAGLPGPRVVAIAGPVGSGKSTLARALSTCVVSTDDYLPDYHRLPEHERDEPRHADMARLAADLASLRDGRETRVPVWSFESHARVGERPLVPASLIVVEGIHALHEPLLPLLDVRVFVDAPRGVRWDRWEALEARGERGWGVERARAYFDHVAEPTFARFAPLYRARAHVLVINAG